MFAVHVHCPGYNQGLKEGERNKGPERGKDREIRGRCMLKGRETAFCAALVRVPAVVLDSIKVAVIPVPILDFMRGYQHSTSGIDLKGRTRDTILLSGLCYTLAALRVPMTIGL